MHISRGEWRAHGDEDIGGVASLKFRFPGFQRRAGVASGAQGDRRPGMRCEDHGPLEYAYRCVRVGANSRAKVAFREEFA